MEMNVGDNLTFKIFFKTQAEEDLWVKLNAEHQIEWEKSLTYFDNAEKIHKPTMQALNPRSMDEAIQIAKNQLAYDKKVGVLRHSLEDYLTMTTDELTAETQRQHKEFFKDFKLK